MTRIIPQQLPHRMSYGVIQKRKISDREEVVEEGQWKGAILTLDPSGGTIVGISTRSALDVDRWESMPSLADFSSLQRLDLYKNRYIETVDETVVELKELLELSATRCSKLKSLPQSIGRLASLQVVRMCTDKVFSLFGFCLMNHWSDTSKTSLID